MFDCLRRLADRTSRVDALVQGDAYGPMEDIAIFPSLACRDHTGMRWIRHG